MRMAQPYPDMLLASSVSEMIPYPDYSPLPVTSRHPCGVIRIPSAPLWFTAPLPRPHWVRRPQPTSRVHRRPPPG